MGKAAKVVGFDRWDAFSGAKPLRDEVAANSRFVIRARTEAVTVAGNEDNWEITWSGDLGTNPTFPSGPHGSSVETYFALGTHTFGARGAAGGKSFTLKATDTGTHT